MFNITVQSFVLDVRLYEPLTSATRSRFLACPRVCYDWLQVSGPLQNSLNYAMCVEKLEDTSGSHHILRSCV